MRTPAHEKHKPFKLWVICHSDNHIKIKPIIKSLLLHVLSEPRQLQQSQGANSIVSNVLVANRSDDRGIISA